MRTFLSMLVLAVSLAWGIACVPAGQSQQRKQAPTGPERGKASDGYFHVIATGETMRDATRLARRMIVEDGLGAYVESHSVSVDAQLKEQIIKATSSGFVYDFHVVEVISKSPTTKIHAKGKVSEKAVAQAIKYRYAEIGKPRLLIVFEETIGGRASAAGRTISASKLIARFADFQFVSPGVSRRLEATPGGVFSNKSAWQSVLDAARDADADFLVVGHTEVEQGPKVEGSAMYMIRAHVKFRMVSVATSVILADSADTYTVPFINVRQGGVLAIERAVDAAYDSIIEQIGAKWEPGQTIRIVLEGLDYDRFTDLGVVGKMRKWEKIGSVQDRGKDSSGNVVIEVEALLSGSDFYRLLRSRRAELGLEFKSIEVKNNRLRLQVTKAGP